MPERDDHGEQRIAGRYRLAAVLGRGGMGTVWRAHDELLRRDVAVKQVELPPALPEEERDALRRRVMREAQAAARLTHRSSVTVFDVVEEAGRLYIVMELVDAPTLEDLVRVHGPLTPQRAAGVGRDLVDVLEAAHAHGIVHRDVKPSNIMVLPSGSVKLTDFGIASVRDHPSITRTGQVVGSPSYMPPELVEGRPAQPASDWWELGATLYFAVEGRAPFEREGLIPTLHAVVHGDPDPMQRAGPLAPLIRRLLAKDPGQRPGAHALHAELEAAARAAPGPGDTLLLDGPSSLRASAAERAGPDPPVAPPPAPPAPPSSPGRRLADATPGPAPPAPPRGTTPARPAVALALAVAVVAGLLGVVAWRAASQGGDDGRAASPPRTSSPTTAPPATKGERPPRTTSSVRATSVTPSGVPAEWVRYTDSSTGYRISHPPGWQVRRLDRTRTDIRDPASGSYLRVDWTDTPGDSPEEAWRQLSRSFGASHAGYEELRIEPTTYKGFDAAVWEYRYSAGGARLHAVNLGMVTGPYGFALNFQTREQEWEAKQPMFEAFKASFEPPAR